MKRRVKAKTRRQLIKARLNSGGPVWLGKPKRFRWKLWVNEVKKSVGPGGLIF